MTDDDYKPEQCARCGVLGQDRRTLWMACFYAMNELGVPFKEVGIHGVLVQLTGHDPKWGAPQFEEPPGSLENAASTRALFTLRVCKGCRAEWMRAIEAWYRAPAGDISRWNNDASTYRLNDTLPKVLADAEKLRTDLIALEQRVADVRRSALDERLRRDAEDRT
jgi:hypothetical protein